MGQGEEHQPPIAYEGVVDPSGNAFCVLHQIKGSVEFGSDADLFSIEFADGIVAVFCWNVRNLHAVVRVGRR